MLLLVQFATLSLGFYAAVTSSVQAARNDLEVTDAQRASQSRLRLISCHIAHASSSTDGSFNAFCANRESRLNGTTNLCGRPVTRTTGAAGRLAAYIPGTPGSAAAAFGPAQTGTNAAGQSVVARLGRDRGRGRREHGLPERRSLPWAGGEGLKANGGRGFTTRTGHRRPGLSMATQQRARPAIGRPDIFIGCHRAE